MRTASALTASFTCHRDSDGCDETWDICDARGNHLVSIPFWDDEARAEAEARFIVRCLNALGPLVDALRNVVEMEFDRDPESRNFEDERLEAFACLIAEAGGGKPGDCRISRLMS